MITKKLLLMAICLGPVFVSCGEGDDPCDGAECCAEKTCKSGLCVEGTCVADPCPDDECCEIKECAQGGCFDGVCMMCCDDRENFGFIAGTIAEFPLAGTMAQVGFAVVPVMEILVNPTPTHLEEGETDSSGEYQTGCYDMNQFGVGITILSDDPGFDGIGGTWFPTYSIVMDLTSIADRTCEPKAPPTLAVPVALVDQLSRAPQLSDIATSGFAIVVITDADLTPVDGAVLNKHYRGGCSTGNSEGTEELPEAVYPNADFTAFNGTATSTNGVVIIPKSAFPSGLLEVTAVKDGMTWEEGFIASIDSCCISRFLIANE